MDIVVFSDNPDISSCFHTIGNAAGYSTNYLPYKDLRRSVKTLKKNTFIYIDVSGLQEEKRKKLLKYLSKYSNRGYGIIDITRKVKDIGTLFHQGASDYIGRETYLQGVSLLRLRKAYELHQRKSYEAKEAGEIPDISEFIISGEDAGRIIKSLFLHMLPRNSIEDEISTTAFLSGDGISGKG